VSAVQVLGPVEKKANVDDLKTLTALLDMANEAEELATNNEKTERLSLLVEEMKGTAREERKRLHRDQLGTRYDLCMTGILEELSFVGKKGIWDQVIGLDSRLIRVREEIDRTIKEINAKRRIM
jgi:hypothetical protein